MFDEFDTQIQAEEYEEYYWNNDDDFYREEYPEESFTPKQLNLDWQLTIKEKCSKLELKGKNDMAKTKSDVNKDLKQVVDNLISMFPNHSMYTRAQVNQAAEAAGSNLKGLMAFCATSKYGGHAAETKLSRGSYIIPKAWTNGDAPWDTVKEVVVEQKSPKSKKIAA